MASIASLSSPSSLGSTNPDADPFAPWLAPIDQCSARWAPLPTHNNRLGVLVELCVDMTTLVLDEDDDFEDLLQLREAIDLVVLALAIEPPALRALLHNKFADDETEKLATDDDAIDTVLAHGARTELRLQFEFKSIDTRLLNRQLATHFIHNLGAQLSTNEEFRKLRDPLVEKLRVDEAALDHMRHLTVPITMAIDSDELDQISSLDAEDFFVHLTAFCKTLEEIRSQTQNTNWGFDTAHVPLTIQSIDLTLQRFCITYRVTQAAKDFANAGVRVDLKHMILDPRLISCSDQDVSELVAALANGASDLTISTGIDRNEDLPANIDMRGQDRREIIRAILGAVARTQNLHELDLGGLLSLCFAPQNRREVKSGGSCSVTFFHAMCRWKRW